MSIELPKLPFSEEALAPLISAKTIQFHYGKHHKGYVDKLNGLIKDTELDKYSLEEIIQFSSDKELTKIFNNASQAWNHSFMWNGLASRSTPLSSRLEEAISEEFESVDKFKEKFITTARDLFGSGWVWLVKDKNSSLKIRALKDGDSPLVYNDIPLLTCDVWEHAYYLDYQNEREKYLKNYWEIINWGFVEANMERTQTLSRTIPGSASEHFKLNQGARL